MAKIDFAPAQSSGFIAANPRKHEQPNKTAPRFIHSFQCPPYGLQLFITEHSRPLCLDFSMTNSGNWIFGHPILVLALDREIEHRRECCPRAVHLLAHSLVVLDLVEQFDEITFADSSDDALTELRQNVVTQSQISIPPSPLVKLAMLIDILFGEIIHRLNRPRPSFGFCTFGCLPSFVRRQIDPSFCSGDDVASALACGRQRKGLARVRIEPAGDLISLGLAFRAIADLPALRALGCYPDR